MGKGENAGNQHFLLSSKSVFPIILSSAYVFNLDQSKILSFGKGLNALNLDKSSISSGKGIRINSLDKPKNRTLVQIKGISRPKINIAEIMKVILESLQFETLC